MDDLAYKLATAKLADDPDQSDPKDAAQPADGTRRLPYIPLEILQQIAGHLDRPSAFALTLTCKGLRDAGETRLWGELDITSGWNEPVGTYSPGIFSLIRWASTVEELGPLVVAWKNDHVHSSPDSRQPFQAAGVAQVSSESELRASNEEANGQTNEAFQSPIPAEKHGSLYTERPMLGVLQLSPDSRHTNTVSSVSDVSVSSHPTA